MSESRLESLRREVDDLDAGLLDLVSRRAEVVREIARLKEGLGYPTHDPVREQQMLSALRLANRGPLPDGAVEELFRAIFTTSRTLMDRRRDEDLLVSRRQGPERGVEVGGRRVGEEPLVVAGPCAVESWDQVARTAAFLASRGVRWLRGGLWKPRTSPYDFQGLGAAALDLLAQAARDNGMASVTEVVDTRHVAMVAERIDVLQVGARNMQNFELLKEVGRAGRPVLLKRGPSATLQELLRAAEYVLLHGGPGVVLCERGVRGFERETRYTLDISAVPLLRQSTWLPVLVDVSHAAGRRDILAPLARAAFAAGAHGVMVEVHPQPAVALSDAQQQLDFDAFDRFLADAFPGPRPLEIPA